MKAVSPNNWRKGNPSQVLCGMSLYWTIIIMCLLSIIPGLESQDKRVVVACTNLRMGQYRCNETLDINPLTQQPRNCTENNYAKVSCETPPELICKETGTNRFERQVPCRWTNGYSYSTTLLLSVFLGFLGADRFYLGHVGMGALKFCTLGFLFVGHIVDIILIATQNILPKDGSSYVVGYYGPVVRPNNFTYFVRPSDWF